LQSGCKLGGNCQTADCYHRARREGEYAADTCETVILYPTDAIGDEAAVSERVS